MELHVALRELVDRLGPGVFGDPVTLRGVLDDYLDEDVATTGDVNLLVDAARLGAVAHLARTMSTGAAPLDAAAAAGERLARERGGGDPRASSWACAVLGYALGMFDASVVQQFAPRPFDAAPGTLKPPIGIDREAQTQPAPHATLSRPETPASAPRGRTLATVVVAVLVAVVLGAGGAYLLMSSNDVTAAPRTGDSPDTDAAASSEASSSTTSEESSPTELSSSVPSPTPVRSRANALCWDGSKVEELASCTYPMGINGLEWVFPDAADPGCGAVAQLHNGRIVDRYCPVTLDDGDTAEFHYSQWGDFDEMRLNYRADQAGPDLLSDRDDLHVFGVIDSDAAHKIVAFYRLPDAPWSVTVYADTEDDMASAVAMLQVRPVKELRGVGRQQQYLPASFAVSLVPRP